MTNYHHAQTGLVGYLMVAISIGTASASTQAPPDAFWPLIAAATVCASLAACFWTLAIRVNHERIHVYFGPIPLFHTSRLVADLTGATASRSDLLDGWGIHRLPGRSPIWNLHGFDCVELSFRDGKRLRLGTNDLDGLLAAINAQLPQEPEAKR